MNPQTLIFIALIIGVYYFLLIRPRQQEAKRTAEMLASLQPGIEIVTIGGIFATIVSLSEDRARVEVADGSQLEISKRAIGRVVEPDAALADQGDTDGDDADEPAMADADATTDADAEPLDAFGSGPDSDESSPADV